MGYPSKLRASHPISTQLWKCTLPQLCQDLSEPSHTRTAFPKPPLLALRIRKRNHALVTPASPILGLVRLLVCLQRESTLAPKCIRILSQFSPNIKKLSIRLDEPRPMFNKLISNYICRWSKPQAVCCPQITLDMHDLTHLSRAPSLPQLSFALNTDAIPPSDTLLFSTSRELKLFPEPSVPI